MNDTLLIKEKKAVPLALPFLCMRIEKQTVLLSLAE